MLLSDNSELFKNLVEEINRQTGILEEYIEKDFYAITILKELVKRNDKFVFKGGTSLSVCQHAVNRFSEDIDISYSEETITVSQRKAIKKAFFDSIEAASLSVSNPDNIRSRRVFNRYLCPYQSKWNLSEDRVIVEWATQTPSFPIEEKTAQTIIGKYLESIGRHDLVEQYDLGPFVTKTLTKERTMVDKIFAICDYHLSKKLERQSRHIYDIQQLIKYVELDDNFIDVFNRVKDCRVKLENCYSVHIDKKISDLLIELVEEKTFKNDYDTKSFPLLYDHVKYEECVPYIIKVSNFLKKYNL